MDEKNSSVWLRCPKCGSKTRDKILPQTIMINYPLYCPKCKRELLVSVKNLSITIIKEPDAQTQGRQTCEKSQFVGSVLLYRKGRTSPPNKKNEVRRAAFPCFHFPLGFVLKFGGIFMCRRKPITFCRLPMRAFTYIASWISEDSLLKKSSLVHGTTTPQKQMPNFYTKEV